MATLLVSLLGGVPSALADPLGLDLIPIGADPAFGWMMLLPNDPPATIDPALILFYAQRVTYHATPPAPATAMGNLAPKAAANYGALTPIASPSNPACAHSNGVAFHPSGRYVYLSGGIGSPGALCGYSIDPVTQAFAPIAGMPVATGALPKAVAIDPSGRYVYVVSAVQNNVSAYQVDPATGTLAPIAGSPFTTNGGTPQGMVIDRGGRHLYVANFNSNTTSVGTVAAFAIDRATGALAHIAGSPFLVFDGDVVDGISALALTPDGRFLFTLGYSLTTFSVDAATGALKRIAKRGPVYLGSVAVDPTGRFLYASDSFLNAVDGFAIAADGSLTPAGTQPTGGGPGGMAILGDLLYFSSTKTSLTHGFRINPVSGALAPVLGSPFATGSRSFVLAGQGFLATTMQIAAGDYFVAPLGAFGGQPPYTFSIAKGALPPGLALNATTGVIAGTAATGGVFTFTAQVTDSANATASHAKTIFVGGTPHVTVPVVEFYHASLDHYFNTWVPDEIAKLDAGTVIKGWTRTGKSFRTFTTVQGSTSPVCRYYIPPALGDSHYFGRGTVECDDTGRKNPSFVLEEASFMHMILPNAGVCPGSTFPVYRVFSNRPDANHRYTIERQVRDAMVAKGWLAEGDGPDLVVMCAPT